MSEEMWEVDLAHSSISFRVRHLMLSRVHGRFTRWTASFVLDEHRPADARVAADIDPASVDTRHEERDAHLRSVDFLDVDKHHEITFRSTSVAPLESRSYRMMGDLTIRGTSRRVML